MENRKTKKSHDPREFVRGLQQILVSDSKRVGFLFGAGTSMSCKKGCSKASVIPGIQEMIISKYIAIVVYPIRRNSFALRMIFTSGHCLLSAGK
jgi:hypothetical protein